MQLFRLYQETINIVKQKFTRDELSMMLDVMNGTYIDPHTISRVLIANVEDSFKLYPGQYEEKWQVKKEEMLPKLESLNEFQASCLAIWANDFWYGSETGAGELDLEAYIKDAPIITQQLSAISHHLQEAINLMEASKSAFKSAQIAEARESAKKAMEILGKLL